VTDILQLAVIIASTRPGRIGAVVGNWFVEQAGQRDMKIDVIDLADLRLPMDLADTPEAREFAARVAGADAYVLVTPEYNHGYPAALKVALDSVRDGWKAKPVGFVSYGGLSGGLRAVEQLRAVCAELHMTTVRDAVSFHLVRNQFDEHGRPHHPRGAVAAADRLLDALDWWARALRTAREAEPYRW
jgi:NAD(P)H-dependent FMN reductase